MTDTGMKEPNDKPATNPGGRTMAVRVADKPNPELFQRVVGRGGIVPFRPKPKPGTSDHAGTQSTNQGHEQEQDQKDPTKVAGNIS